MAIHIITGKPGSGKTYVLAQKAQEFVSQDLDIYSNFWLNTDSQKVHYYKDFRELIDVKNGIILMDEAQIYLNCRTWDTLDPLFQYKLQQHRKHGLDIWGTVQSVTRLDVVFRELVSTYFEVHKLGTGEKKGGGLPEHPFGLFFVTEYDVKDAIKVRRKRLSFKVYLMRKKVLHFYDTLKDLGFAEADESGIINVRMQVCPTCGSQRILDRPKSYKKA